MDVLKQAHQQYLNNLGVVYKRQSIQVNTKDGSVYKGLVGQRGVGKTTLLLDYIRENYGTSRQALYISADHIYFTQNTLVDLAQKFVQEENGKLLCVDEIHRYANWAQEIKNIYDLFHTKLQVIFSGSSSINLVREKYDLSRRVGIQQVYGFSFREWLEFNHGIKLPILELNQLLGKGKDSNLDEIVTVPGILGLFKEYLVRGYFPLSNQVETDREYLDILISTMDKTIYQDISSLYSLNTPTLNILKKLMAFVATSSPSKINSYKLARSVGRHHNKVAEYLDILKEAGLVRYLTTEGYGHRMISEAEKVYLENTNLFYAIAKDFGKEANIGTIRELYTFNQLVNAGYKVFYTEKGDFAVENYVFEIGGENKDRRQLDGVKNGFLIKDDILYPQNKVIPIYMLGLLY